MVSKRTKRSDNEEQRLNRQKRQAQTKEGDVTVELAIVSDAAATAYYDAGGATTDDERIEMVAMKWYGVRFKTYYPHQIGSRPLRKHAYFLYAFRWIIEISR